MAIKSLHGLSTPEEIKEFKDIEVLNEYIDRCWTSYLHYKTDQDKIMFFGGTLFITIIAATGIAGATRAKDQIVHFTIYHTILFHFIFFILFLFYIHKSMTCEIYALTARKAEAYILKKIGLTTKNKLVGFSVIKSKYIGSSNWFGTTNMGTWANVLCLILYVCVSVAPNSIGYDITKGVNWDSIIAFLIFVFFFAIVIFFSKRKRKKIIIQINNDWSEIAK